MLTPAYVEDLAISKLENQWVVDQASNQLIKHKVLAVTEAGERVMLESSVASPIVYGRVSDLPSGWFDITAEIMPDTPVDQYPIAPPVEKQLLEGASKANLLQPADQQAFSLVQEIDDTTGNYSAQTSADRVVFRITQAGQRGNAVERIYANPTSEAIFRLIQGPSSQLVPAMRKSEAAYARSELRNIRMGEKGIDVWIASGGALDQLPKQLVAMFEYEDKFVYVIAQNADEAALVAFLSSLGPGTQ
jgi:hypothetical protein